MDEGSVLLPASRVFISVSFFVLGSDATNLSRELYNSDQAPSSRDHFGPGNKSITPTIINGKVYVGTTDGVAVFELLP